MKKVRILKNGRSNCVDYKKGEIWDLIKISNTNARIKNNKNEETAVSIIYNNLYGLEAEIIDENELLTFKLW